MTSPRYSWTISRESKTTKAVARVSLCCNFWWMLMSTRKNQARTRQLLWYSPRAVPSKERRPQCKFPLVWRQGTERANFCRIQSASWQERRASSCSWRWPSAWAWVWSRWGREFESSSSTLLFCRSAFEFDFDQINIMNAINSHITFNNYLYCLSFANSWCSSFLLNSASLCPDPPFSSLFFKFLESLEKKMNYYQCLFLLKEIQ